MKVQVWIRFLPSLCGHDQITPASLRPDTSRSGPRPRRPSASHFPSPHLGSTLVGAPQDIDRARGLSQAPGRRSRKRPIPRPPARENARHRNRPRARPDQHRHLRRQRCPPQNPRHLDERHYSPPDARRRPLRRHAQAHRAAPNIAIVNRVPQARFWPSRLAWNSRFCSNFLILKEAVIPSRRAGGPAWVVSSVLYGYSV